jgi:endogenous inhibitor of DNA gyrase (YacG/DUF329 family)
MIIAYKLGIYDDGTYMLGGPTYRATRIGGFHDWRFGQDGVPHPATCPECGSKTDRDYINPDFRPKKRRRDINSTYDGCIIVSRRFRDFCRRNGWKGLTFVRLPADSDFFVLHISSLLRFDAKKRKTRFENPCPTCGGFYSVIGADPVYLRGVRKPIQEGFFRSDLEFGSGPMKHALTLVGIKTAERLTNRKFPKFYLKEVEA